MLRLSFLSALLLGTMITAAHAQTAFDDPMTSSAGSGGTLVAVEPSIAAGSIALGSTAQAIVRFRNEGGQPITFGDINLYPSSNVSLSIAMNQCAEAPLQFGGECAIVLALKALKAGEFQSQMLIQHSGRSKLITANVTGTVEAGDKDDDQGANEIQAIPATLDFADIKASRPTLRTIQLRNTTSEKITIKDVLFDSPQKNGFDVRTECKELAPGQSCLVSVVWAPLLPGPASGFVVVNHSGTSQITNIPVDGEYDPAAVEDVSKYPSPVPGKGLLIASEEQADFGSEVDTESAVTITLVNDGDADMTLKNMTMSIPIPGLSVDPSGCKIGTVLTPTDACPLTVRWAPQKIGTLKTDLRITHDGARGVFVLPVGGKSTAIVQNTSFTSGVGMDSPAEDMPAGGSGNLTDLPGSAGLTLADIEELNGALSGDIAEVIERSTGKTGPATKARKAREEARAGAAANTLSSYIITSHSINRAILMGPQGSKIVTHNKPVTIGTVAWTPEITPEGVKMVSDIKTVMLVFDPSLTTNQAMLTDNSATATSDGFGMEAITEDGQPQQVTTGTNSADQNTVVSTPENLPPQDTGLNADNSSGLNEPN